MVERVKFFSINDLGMNRDFFVRARHVLDDFISTKHDPDTMEDAMELQNVIQVVDHGAFSKLWSEDYIQKIQQVSPVLLSTVKRYLSSRNTTEILEAMKKIYPNYREDFFEDFKKFKYGQKISEQEFKTSFIESGIPNSYLLTSTYFSKTYPDFLRSSIMNDPLSIELLLSNYTNNSKQKLFFPTDITSKEWDQLLEQYIKNPNANPNYLSLLSARSIKGLDGKKYFGVSPKQRICVQERLKQLAKQRQNINKGLQIKRIIYLNRKEFEKASKEAKLNKELSLKETLDKCILNTIRWNAGEEIPQNSAVTLRLCVDKDQIDQSHDFKSLLEYFRQDFGFFSKRIIFTLPTYPNNEIGPVMRNVSLQTSNAYANSKYFQVKQESAICKLRVVAKLLSKWNITIVDLIQWFFTDYCKNNYDLFWLPLTFPNKNESVANKTTTLLGIEENIRTQYYIFRQEKMIESELVNVTPTPSIESLTSLCNQKYAYLQNNDIVNYTLYLLFSDQSKIIYINDKFQAESFSSLISDNNLKISDFHEYQKADLNYLTDHNILQKKDGYIKFKSALQIKLLKEMYLFGSISFVHATDEEKNILTEMERDHWTFFQGTLFTSQEADYLNFLLNDKKFDNSLAIRNRYQHHLPYYNDEQYENDNTMILIILITYVIKIDDELKIQKELA